MSVKCFPICRKYAFSQKPLLGVCVFKADKLTDYYIQLVRFPL